MGGYILFNTEADITDNGIMALFHFRGHISLLDAYAIH
jgi:hypothetical protein